MALQQGAIRQALNGTATVSASTGATHILIVVCGIVGIIFAAYQLYVISAIKVEMPEGDQEALLNGDGASRHEMNEKLQTLYTLISEGANSFLFAEYKICAIFIVLMSALILVLTALSGKSTSKDGSWDWQAGAITAVSFAVGAVTSILSGFIGMTVATVVKMREDMGYNVP